MDNQRFEELLIGELTGNLTPAERQELTAFLQADAAHRKEYEIFKDFWAQKDIAYTDNQSVLDKIKTRIGIQEENRGPVRRFYWRSAAAVLLFVLGGYGVYHHFYAARATSHDPLDWQEKYTARKTRSKMILADGSSVMLNADSRLKYPASFDGPVREVYLTGEAFFDIQKDPEHPFIIHTDKMNIRVLGTAFNVKSYPGDASMETTLLQGSVEVTFPDRPADKIILKPTDKLVIHNFVRAGDSAEAAGPAAPMKKTGGNPDAKYTLTGLTYYRNQKSTVIETSWIDNKLAFSKEEFRSLARRMERWYGVSIVFDNERLMDIPFTGLFQKESIQEALYALQLSEKFQYSMEGSVIHIY